MLDSEQWILLCYMIANTKCNVRRNYQFLINTEKKNMCLTSLYEFKIYSNLKKTNLKHQFDIGSKTEYSMFKCDRYYDLL